MVAIIVLTIAIVPMAGMFEAAIEAADAGGEYDEARTCAVQKLEQVRACHTRWSKAVFPGAPANLPASDTRWPHGPSVRISVPFLKMGD